MRKQAVITLSITAIVISILSIGITVGRSFFMQIEPHAVSSRRDEYMRDIALRKVPTAAIVYSDSAAPTVINRTSRNYYESGYPPSVSMPSRRESPKLIQKAKENARPNTYENGLSIASQKYVEESLGFKVGYRFSITDFSQLYIDPSEPSYWAQDVAITVVNVYEPQKVIGTMKLQFLIRNNVVVKDKLIESQGITK